jgi:hypothetical protein
MSPTTPDKSPLTYSATAPGALSSMPTCLRIKRRQYLSPFKQSGWDRQFRSTANTPSRLQLRVAWVEPVELLDRHSHNTRSHHAECPGGADRHVNDPPPNKWSAIIDAAMNGVTSVGNCYDASESPSAMSAGHFSGVTPSAVVRGKPGLRFARRGRQQEKSKTQTNRYTTGAPVLTQPTNKSRALEKVPL